MVGQLSRPQSEGERFLGVLKEAGPQLHDTFMEAMKPKREEEENAALEKLTGKNFRGLSPDIKQLLLKGEMSKKGGGAEQQKTEALQAGLGTINEMRQYIKSAGPSHKFQSLFPGATAKNRAHLAQLGRSLIPLVSAGVSIRNQQEFNEYKKIIADPDALQSEIEGALDGLQSIIERQLGGGESEMGQNEMDMEGGGGEDQLVKVVAPNGKTKMIPKSQVKAAMAAGGKVTR